MELTVTRSTRGGEDLLRVSGVLDFASAPYLRQLLFELYDQGRHDIVIDLAGTRLVDASALRVLLYLQRRAEEHGGGLRVCGATDMALTAMEIAGTAKQLRAYDELGWTALERIGEPVDLGTLRLSGRHWPPEVTVELTRLHTATLAPATRRRLRDGIVEACLPAARRLARRYSRSSEPTADLEQVAYVGLLKAVDGFDPARGMEFVPYATTTIVGELKRHFRDRVWTVRVPRALQQRWMAVGQARDELTATLKRSPGVSDIAEHLGLDEEEVLEALDVGSSFRPVSLDVPVRSDTGEEQSLMDRLGSIDPQFGSVEHHESLRVLLARLPQRTQRILALRFYGGLSQHEIAVQVGLSQMHISRILQQTLQQLRAHLEEVPS